MCASTVTSAPAPQDGRQQIERHLVDRAVRFGLPRPGLQLRPPCVCTYQRSEGITNTKLHLVAYLFPCDLSCRAHSHALARCRSAAAELSGGIQSGVLDLPAGCTCPGRHVIRSQRGGRATQARGVLRAHTVGSVAAHPHPAAAGPAPARGAPPRCWRWARPSCCCRAQTPSPPRLPAP